MLVNVIDTPGAKCYAKNKLSNIALADFGVVCVQSTRGVFDQAFYGASSLN